MPGTPSYAGFSIWEQAKMAEPLFSAMGRGME
jgi:hypothetical protein